MVGYDVTAMRAEGETHSQLVTVTGALLEDKIAYKEDVTADTDETVTNLQLSETKQQAFAGVESATLIVVNSGATNSVDIGYTLTLYKEGVAFTTTVSGTITAAAGKIATQAITSDDMIFADGYSINWTSSAVSTVSIYLKKSGQS